MKPVDVKSKTYINFNKKNYYKDGEIGDYARISKDKNIFCKNLRSKFTSEEVFVIKKVKIPVPSTYVIRDLNGEETIEIFTKKSYKKKSERI